MKKRHVTKYDRCERRRRVIEPMMTHRKPVNRHQKPTASKVGDELVRSSEGCTSGVRCKVGASFFQALFRNCGNPSLGCKGRNTNYQHNECESTNARHGDGTARSSEEVLVMGMERRGSVKQYRPSIQLLKQEEIA